MKIGMVSTRFAGVDGVSLESAKWAAVLRSAGHDLVWFAGELGDGFTPGTERAAAHFDTAEARALGSLCFGSPNCPPGTMEVIAAAAAGLRLDLAGFIDRFGIDLVVVQNASAIPMQLPFGVAIAEVLGETGLPAIGHHHDLWWERGRYEVNCIPDLLNEVFPPEGMAHVVISAAARRQLRIRRDVAATVIPNVMDFERAPAAADGIGFRSYCGVDRDTRLILQPTRVIPRKSIETTLELAARVLRDAAVVVSHAETDRPEPFRGHASYGDFLRAEAIRLSVDLRFCPVGRVGQPSLADAYAAADLVAYPSTVEGFGNALLEAFYYRRPVFVRRYPVYVDDIAPTGVRCIEIGDVVTDAAVDEASAWLDDPGAWDEAAGANYQAGLEHFSYRVLRDRLLPLLG